MKTHFSRFLVTATLLVLAACSNPTEAAKAPDPGMVIFEAGIGPALEPVSGTVASAPVMEIDDYYFAGWYDDAEFNVKTTFPAEASSGDRTLYAYWKAASPGFTYVENDTGYSVTTSGYYQAIDQIVIPDVHAGLPVTQIGVEDLGGVGYMMSYPNYHIDIPANVTTLGYHAFYGIYAPELTIPSTVTKIAGDAFGVTNIAELTVLAVTPPIVDTSSGNLFQNASVPTTFNVPEGSESAYAEADGWSLLFSGVI